jgi:sugar lactone lactonase YvrE
LKWILISENGLVGVVIPVEDTEDKLIVGCLTDILLVTWDGESDVINPPIEILTSFPTDISDTRINDGKCDAAGRFWAGFYIFIFIFMY